jgi:hypothetical protein
LIAGRQARPSIELATISISSIQQPFPYPEHQFVNLVWAIESLHRGWQRDAGESPKVARRQKRIEDILSRFFGEGDRKPREWLAGRLKYAYEPTLENRIVESYDRLPFELDPPKLRAFAERCARCRNDIRMKVGVVQARMLRSFSLNCAYWPKRCVTFHALLLHEVGLSSDLLLKALTRGGIGSMSVILALREVGIELPAAPEE